MWWYAEQAFRGNVLLHEHEAGRLSQHAWKACLAITACGKRGAGAKCSFPAAIESGDVFAHATVGKIGRRRNEQVLDLDFAGKLRQVGY